MPTEMTCTPEGVPSKLGLGRVAHAIEKSFELPGVPRPSFAWAGSAGGLRSQLQHYINIFLMTCPRPNLRMRRTRPSKAWTGHPRCISTIRPFMPPDASARSERYRPALFVVQSTGIRFRLVRPLHLHNDGSYSRANLRAAQPTRELQDSGVYSGASPRTCVRSIH